MNDTGLRWMKRTVATVAAAVLVGCGGGITLYWDDWDDEAPVVDLVAAASTAPAGSQLRLVAAAADNDGIDHVTFYRYDGNTAVRLGSDSASPYDWQLSVPADGRGSVTVFARAVDLSGNVADSQLVSIAITP